MAAAKDTLFVPITDTSYGEGSNHKRKPGLFSINAGNGELNWYSQTNDRCRPDVRLGCDPGLSAAITGTENAIFAGGLDGYLYAFDTETGDVIWEFATDKEFDSLSGDIARGGSIDADGPVVIDGHVLINSGYSFGGRMPGNALLVFSVDGK
jgi:polyvinyl alcohol dehydrogenase (cytochrome)